MSDSSRPAHVPTGAVAEVRERGGESVAPRRKHERSPVSVVSTVEDELHERSGLKKRERALERLPHEIRDADEHALCKRLAAFSSGEAVEEAPQDEPEGFDSELAFLLHTGVALDDEDKRREAHQLRAMPYLC